MNFERKQKLLKYLYPTEKIRSFMCNDLYVELHAVMPKVCILSKNVNFQIRKKNLESVYNTVKVFFKNNHNYKRQIEGLFCDKNYEEVLNDIVIGYVFFVANTSNIYSKIDIFKDKKSICYCPISVIDLI